ncbi:hypothetical protein FVE85_8780 [Porphyridium purpureum]|uniref:Glycosyltransferase 61 catalytic domain-containing protein n=1 Tax=Porphyridium purpureum TaxID=35688 RepID=A0A5J4YQ46_PORPP|nr:hypothetical protein FVE85_8780 [Porphyridium purpureum]|eukprot:POR5749..scf296_7
MYDRDDAASEQITPASSCGNTPRSALLREHGDTVDCAACLRLTLRACSCRGMRMRPRVRELLLLFMLLVAVLLFFRQRRHASSLAAMRAISAGFQRHTYTQSDFSGAVLVAPLCLRFPRRYGAGAESFDPRSVQLMTPASVATCTTISKSNDLFALNSRSQLCDKPESQVLRDAFLPVPLLTMDWAEFMALQMQQRVAWIEEDTLLMAFPRSESVDQEQVLQRIMMLAHVRNNPTMYRLRGAIESMVLMFNGSFEELYAKQHPFVAEMLHSVLFPGRLDLDAPLQAEMTGIVRGKRGYLDEVFGKLLTGAGSGGGATSSASRGGRNGVLGFSSAATHVCFRRALLPSLLRNKLLTHNSELWVNTGDALDAEHEAGKRASVQFLAHRNLAPREWEFVRSTVFQRLGMVGLPKVLPTVVYLRRARVHALDAQAEKTLLDFVRPFAARYKYDLLVLDYDDVAFATQVKVLVSACMVISTHGAHLMATIFMQPKTVLVEMFPKEYASSLYAEGVGKRLKYFPVVLQHVAPGAPAYFAGLGQFNGDKKACMHASVECLEHFRSDHRPLVFSSGDQENLRSRLQRAFLHLDNTLFPEHSAAAGR